VSGRYFFGLARRLFLPVLPLSLKIIRFVIAVFWLWLSSFPWTPRGRLRIILAGYTERMIPIFDSRRLKALLGIESAALNEAGRPKTNLHRCSIYSDGQCLYRFGNIVFVDSLIRCARAQRPLLLVIFLPRHISLPCLHCSNGRGEHARSESGEESAEGVLQMARQVKLGRGRSPPQGAPPRPFS